MNEVCKKVKRFINNAHKGTLVYAQLLYCTFMQPVIVGDGKNFVEVAGKQSERLVREKTRRKI